MMKLFDIGQLKEWNRDENFLFSGPYDCYWGSTSYPGYTSDGHGCLMDMSSETMENPEEYIYLSEVGREKGRLSRVTYNEDQVGTWQQDESFSHCVTENVEFYVDNDTRWEDMLVVFHRNVRIPRGEFNALELVLFEYFNDIYEHRVSDDFFYGWSNHFNSEET